MVEGALAAVVSAIVFLLSFVWQDFSVVVSLLLQITLPAVVCCVAIHYFRQSLMYRIGTAFGWSGVLAVSWLGTPIHELSHVFFLVLSGVKVTKLSLFEPNRETGGLGYVRYIYIPGNPLHQLGCFLSSLGPLIGGSLAIYLATVLLLPGFTLYQGAGAVPFFQLADVLDWQRVQMALVRVSEFELRLVGQLINGLSLSDWRTYVYVYFVFSVSHNMSPSMQDLKGFPRRLGYFLLALLVLNAPLLLVGFGERNFYGTVLLPFLSAFVATVTAILYLGVLASFCAVAISFPITALARRLR